MIGLCQISNFLKPKPQKNDMKKEFLFATLGALALGGCSDGKNSGENLTPEQMIDRLLAELAQKSAPTNLSLGAMCYDMPCPPERVDYVCPVCENRTIFIEMGVDIQETTKNSYYHK